MHQKEFSLMLHRIMARTRATTEMLILHRSDIFGAFLTGLGQEAVAAGIMGALLDMGIAMQSLKNGDHRNQWALAAGLDEITRVSGHNHMLEIMKNHLCKATSANKGLDGNIHWGCLDCMLLPFLCSDMGRLPPVICGMAEEIARRDTWRTMPVRDRPVGVVFFGEGADSQGVVHETNVMTAASNCKRSEKETAPYLKYGDPLLPVSGVLRGTPLVEIVMVNEHSIYTDPADEHGHSDLAARAKGYGNMAGINVGGDDVEAICSAGRSAVYSAQEFVATRMVVHTYRRTGHNEDMIRRNPTVLEEAREAFRKGNWGHAIDWADGKIEGVDPEIFREKWKREPLRLHRKKLISAGLASEKELDEIICSAREEAWELYTKAKAEPDVTPEDHKNHTSVLMPFPQWTLSEEKPRVATKHKRLGYNDAYIEILREVLEKDWRVTFFGQDVRTGGVLVPTRKLAEQFGPLRVFNTPITEEATHSNAAGRSLVGGRPIVEVQQFAPFSADAFASMLTVVANNFYQKNLRFPFINIFHCGVVRDGGSGEYHEMMPEAFITAMQGIVVVAPADAYDLIGLMRAAHEYEGPVAVILQIHAANKDEFASDIPAESYCIPLGKAKVKREGSDFTVIAYGASCVRTALNEAEELAKENISVEVIDMRTVWPFDLDTLRRSIKKTRRFTVFQEDRESRGVGNTLVSALLKGKDSVLTYLNMESVEVLGALDVPAPTARALVWHRLPYEVVNVEKLDHKNRPIWKPIHRSPKLARMIKVSCGA
ncbi:MAG: hypothetical protein HYT37_03185 [Candidatus Sungbacteria bacterium]|nr:hypothetical protein [Candidatus Sungbacteria bacterium]